MEHPIYSVDMNKTSYTPHKFHIPVMGTGFSIDTPLRVAKFGISSVISIGDYIHIEQMRKHHCQTNNLDYVPIKTGDKDARARSITSYLNLIDDLVNKQMVQIRGESFDVQSDLCKYFRLLPSCPEKELFDQMIAEHDETKKSKMQTQLRAFVVPGSIDVNIMSKIDRDTYYDGELLPPEYGLAMSTLRGYANSKLKSSIVFSAGLNRRLYRYLGEFNDFFPNGEGQIRKRIVLKVSDYRSAVIQGKFFANLGLWVSEFRIESGLNCGGHAFVSKGFLLGPILEEFKAKRSELINDLYDIYSKALDKRGYSSLPSAFGIKITAQGGIYNSADNDFLLKYYDLASTGWGTPFLLVPEVTNVDELHISKLIEAKTEDVHLSQNSPLGVPFWNLKTSTSEIDRIGRIAENKPGSSCPKGYLAFNKEFTEQPLCTASSRYQNLKLKELDLKNLPAFEYLSQKENILAKACICRDLAGGALIKNGIQSNARSAICCGPNIAFFSKQMSLENIVDHIYGRQSHSNNISVRHFLLNELSLYVEYLKKELDNFSNGMTIRTPQYFDEFLANLKNGVQYYSELANNFGKNQKERFIKDLEDLKAEMETLYSGLALKFAI
ncbi:MAG: hypothetical protein ABIJ45_00240 [Candidatus Zixiibacteriota bacterium]